MYRKCNWLGAYPDKFCPLVTEYFLISFLSSMNLLKEFSSCRYFVIPYYLGKTKNDVKIMQLVSFKKWICHNSDITIFLAVCSAEIDPAVWTIPALGLVHLLIEFYLNLFLKSSASPKAFNLLVSGVGGQGMMSLSGLSMAFDTMSLRHSPAFFTQSL